MNCAVVCRAHVAVRLKPKPHQSFHHLMRAQRKPLAEKADERYLALSSSLRGDSRSDEFISVFLLYNLFILTTKMEQSLDDLFNGAFSEVSVGFLENEDLELDGIDFDSKVEEDISQPTEEDEALHQEAAGAASVLCNMEKKDAYVVENADEEQGDDESDEEDVGRVGTSVMSTDKAPQEDFTSSDAGSEEGSCDSGDGGEEADTGAAARPGDLLMSVRCSDEFVYDDKEDEISAVGQSLAPEGSESPQAGNEEQGESEMDEQLSYIGQVPERAGEMMVKGDGSDEDEQEKQEETQEDSSDSESERVRRREENVPALDSEQEAQSPHSLEFSEICVQHERQLSAQAAEEDVAKMEDFSGEEHQEAGETFAEYPSDFSSCEYVEGGGGNPEKERAATDIRWTGKEEDAEEDGDDCLDGRDRETGARWVTGLDQATQEDGKTKVETIACGSDDDQAAESDSYSSSDDDDDDDDDDDEDDDSDDIQGRKYDELSLNTRLLDPENYKDLELYGDSGGAGSGSSISDDHQGNTAAFNIHWDFKFSSLLDEDLLSTVDTDLAASYMNAPPAGDSGSYSVVQRGQSQATHTSHQGSLDDGFFFNTQHVASGAAELGQLGDDEYEEERNWEQEKERIEAFYKFYDDDTEENGREERKTKVQFCADPLSQVIHYETDSDRDSLSSSEDDEEDEEDEEDEDRSSAETSEEQREPDDTLQMGPEHDPPDVEVPDNTEQSEVSNTHTCSRKHKCGLVLKQILRMGLVVLTGTLMFWLATDQADWFGQIPFFKG
ncbi:serine-aspartate repeat-containing protein F isoform X2 [Betta splendens]|uniref:Serine-aspartate repeat-containing protein F isoform X2 n=1 Tax=Betta splendens TaxID=158456 RepID=A0A6P7N4V3_BETSP|nr:serine-aspartate repeat-containing protein F isoform X2 [Betta splendens]